MQPLPCQHELSFFGQEGPACLFVPAEGFRQGRPLFVLGKDPQQQFKILQGPDLVFFVLRREDVVHGRVHEDDALEGIGDDDAVGDALHGHLEAQQMRELLAEVFGHLLDVGDVREKEDEICPVEKGVDEIGVVGDVQLAQPDLRGIPRLKDPGQGKLGKQDLLQLLDGSSGQRKELQPGIVDGEDISLAGDGKYGFGKMVKQSAFPQSDMTRNSFMHGRHHPQTASSARRDAIPDPGPGHAGASAGLPPGAVRLGGLLHSCL